MTSECCFFRIQMTVPNLCDEGFDRMPEDAMAVDVKYQDVS